MSMDYFGDRAPREEPFRKYLAEGKEEALGRLRQAVRHLEERAADARAASVRSHTTGGVADERPYDPSKVFLVHGHDTAAKAEVALFLTRLKLQPIILHERPNKSRVLITKFQEESQDVGFAVVLLTPDDIGGPADTRELADLRRRARQNVVFEFGFFMGTLRPERVAALMKGNIEKPSDIDGVTYISPDNEDWRTRLGQELQEAGYRFD